MIIISSSFTVVYLIFPALQSVSAFSPIVNPVNCPWGQKAFANYLGDNKADWEVHCCDFKAPYSTNISVFPEGEY